MDISYTTYTVTWQQIEPKKRYKKFSEEFPSKAEADEFVYGLWRNPKWHRPLEMYETTHWTEATPD